MAFKLAKLSKRFTFIPPLTPHRFTGSEVRVCDDTIPLTGIAQTVDDCDWTNNGNVPLMVANTLNRTWDRSHSATPTSEDIGRQQLCHNRGVLNRANCISKSSMPSAFINLTTQNNSPKIDPIIRNMSIHKSLSPVKKEPLHEVDGVNIDDIIRSEIEDINGMIHMEKLEVSVIHEIYESLSKLISLLGVPTINTNESDKRFFVGTVLFSIVAFIRNECQRDLHVQNGAPLKDFNITTKGHIDFVVTDGTRKLVVIESKRHNTDCGLVQCILALKHIYDTNSDGADTYGFTTNGVEWRFVKYNGNSATKVKVFEKQILVTMYMHRPMRKERWMEHNTRTLHIIYSAILSAIGVNPPLISSENETYKNKLTEPTVPR